MRLGIANFREDAPKADRAPVQAWQLGLGLAMVGLLGTAVWKNDLLPFVPTQETIPVIAAPQMTTVTALGRLEPQGEVIHVTAPTATQETRVEKLLVKEGDRVKAGQAIAVLSGRDRWQAALTQAKSDLKVAQARLAQVQAGSKSDDILAQAAQVDQRQAQWQGEAKAQQATIDRLQAQWDSDRTSQTATIKELRAEWQGQQSTQKATLKRLQVELTNAEKEYQRYQQLYTAGAISSSVIDSKTLEVDTLRQQVIEVQANLERIDRTNQQRINGAIADLARTNQTLPEQIKEARANLERIQQTGVAQVKEASAKRESLATVRPVDVQVAQAEVEQAQAKVKKAETDLAQTVITAPQNGQILKIYTYPGEKIAEQGIVSLGQTQQMMAIAEVYQGDMGQVRVGQKATVTSPVLDKSLSGTVERIDLEIQRQTIVNEDPAANIDAKVVEVRIRLDAQSSALVTGLTNLQVTTTIHTAH